MLRGAGFKVVDWYGVVAKPQKGHPLLALRE
jgi:hypothetical protein